MIILKIDNTKEIIVDLLLSWLWNICEIIVILGDFYFKVASLSSTIRGQRNNWNSVVLQCFLAQYYIHSLAPSIATTEIGKEITVENKFTVPRWLQRLQAYET